VKRGNVWTRLQQQKRYVQDNGAFVSLVLPFSPEPWPSHFLFKAGYRIILLIVVCVCVEVGYSHQWRTQTQGVNMGAAEGILA
jgi:hypothetical protein